MSSPILTNIQNQLSFYGYTISMILGNIGNVFIVILFSRTRQNACSIYIISSAVANSVYLTYYGFVQIFPFYYLDESIRAFALCKLRLYLANVFGQTGKTMIILACIDRFMITHRSATFRAFSTPKRAKWLIFFSIIFWSVFCVHILVMQTIVNGQCNRFGVYAIIYAVYAILFISLIPPIISGIFGYLTYRHMRQMQVRVQPIVNNRIDDSHSIRRRDRDLLIIVSSEVLVYIVTATPLPFILLEILISPYVSSNKSPQYLQIENFILTITYLLLFINSAIPFYVYLISSKSFSRDFKQLILHGYRKLRRQPIVMPVSRTNQTLTQRDTRV
jgi:hypothetical protein